jgi:TIR domain
MKVFISYAREDGLPSAVQLHEQLANAGFEVWRDIAALSAIDEWRKQIHAALGDCDAVVVLLTPSSVKSLYVNEECVFATARKKPVIPALCLPCDIPDLLNALHYRDLSTTGSRYTNEVIKLIGELNGIQAKLREEIRQALAAMLADASLSNFHAAVRTLESCLNADAYDLRIISATGGLLRRMHSDIRPDRPASSIIQDAIEGSYVGPDWKVYELFHEQKSIFVRILLQLRNDIQDAIPANAIYVPIVLAVMTATEAEELANGSAFTDHPEELHQDFRELQEVLAANGLSDLVSNYGPTPQDWRPFAVGDDVVSIARLTATVFEQLGLEMPLIPSFIDVRALDNKASRRDLRRLRETGCIVVIDTISMRHPAIQRAFQQSMLDAYGTTSVASIAPLQPAFELVRRMRIFLRLKVSDLEFHRRRQDSDYTSHREICEPQDLEQWLSDRAQPFVPPVDPKDIRSHSFKLKGPP